jgi:hypothetical protein
MPDQLPECGLGNLTAAGLDQAGRVRLESLRYATVPEAAEYLAIMRTFKDVLACLSSLVG